ncbi:enoyl-CoA hydratase/isomerase family protein [Halobacterium litoreum]|uniref:Enoyl-CoA hydratase/isomerase family protein n=1 Tax=Halobacterium litoreum TaxID=2039234 RepID=A0ABD5NIG4_9EURY|nr:enoyl-CoA hydratase-related protein [Halobacterium litoreum]UHH12288.1 enoyl-CoA hydratase-related protein [Halobacterium litoreum]
MTVADTAADCEFVEVTEDDPEHVTTVTIDRPDARNALNAQLREELKSVCAAIDDSDARVVVLTGSEDAGAFVAGADVGELRERNAVEQRRASERPRVYEVVEDLRQPVIARLNGHALGGGLELALACDVRVCHERAKLGSPEINLGIIPGGGATQRLPRVVGEGQAMKLVLSGDLVGAEEARDIGLVEDVYGDDFDDEVYDLAASMADNSPLALEYGKDAVKAASRMDLESGIDYEAELFAQLFATADKDEGIDAFFEDRDPEWQGR